MAQRPTSNQIKERLLTPPIDESDGEPTFISDLSTRTFMTIPIFDLESYDKNPRRMLNPNYEKIKESILNNGINQPLVITKRPDAEKYMIYKGGNTRLQALKELYDETGERRFRVVDCSFHPWSGFESDAIIGHIQENEMRKSLCFIDRAYGVKLAIDHLHQESANKDLSLRDYRSMLSRKGYSTTISSLSIMLYAIDIIEPLLAREVCVTMGRPQVQKLRSLENAYRKVCGEFHYSKSTVDKLFVESLKSYEDDEWSYSSFRRCLEAAISDSESISIHDVAIRIDGYLHVSDSPLSGTPTAIDSDCESIDDLDWPDIRTNLTQNESVYTVNTSQTEHSLHNYGANKEIDSVDSDHGGSNDAPKSQETDFPIADVRETPTFSTEAELSHLQQLSYRCASRLAKRYDLMVNKETGNPIITNTGSWGIGYLITDYPAGASNGNPSVMRTRDALWWQLVELCDLRWATERARPTIAKLVVNSKLLNFVKSGNIQTLSIHANGLMKCTHGHLSLLGFCLRQLDESSWNDLSELHTLYRSIHQLSRNAGIQLFQPIKREVRKHK